MARDERVRIEVPSDSDPRWPQKGFQSSKKDAMKDSGSHIPPWHQLYLQLKKKIRSPQVAQWIRIRQPVQGTQVQSLDQEDPTCHRATKPMNHSY